MKTNFSFVLILLCFYSFGQGVTTSQLSGYIDDVDGNHVAGTHIELSNSNTNASYHAYSNENGKYVFNNIKPGSGYTLTINYLGNDLIAADNLRLNLGESHQRNIDLGSLTIEIETIQINDSKLDDKVFTSGSTGNYMSREELEMFPSINRSLLDYLSLNPHSNAIGFMGKGSRDNYISIDGSGFNNVYGIGGPTSALIGNVAGAEPFGIDAIEEIQLDINPYDVSLGGFTGAGINASTKSGSNSFDANVYSYYSHDAIVGNKINGTTSQLSEFSNLRLGANLSGAIIKNKLFYFVNYENNNLTSPASNFLAARPGLEGDNVTRVSASDLDEMSNFLKDNYDYETGPYENYDFQTKNDKWMVKLDWFINDRNRVSFRVSRLNATMEDNNTNSGSFGSGNRVENLNSMSYRNSGQLRTVQATSVIAEAFSSINRNIVNKLSLSYSFFPDSRSINGDPFPAVDILSQGKNYISFGSHMFASNNSINQRNFQIRDEISTVLGNHNLKLGGNLEIYNFEYDFTPAFYGSFVFNSLDDFYNSTPIGNTTPIGLSNGIGRPSVYSRRYSTGGTDAETSVSPKFSRASIYLQDEWQKRNFVFNAGIRMDYNIFSGDLLNNPSVAALEFQDSDGSTETYETGNLPDNHIIFSPRAGFEWQALEKINLRGGAGIFTGLPSMVRIGDQFLNNGLLQGEIIAKNNQANKYPFNPDVNAYIPEDLSEPSTFDLNFVSQDYKAPSLFRANMGIDYFLKNSLRLSFDVTYGNDLNADHVRNANLDHLDPGTATDGRFVFQNSKLNGPSVLGAYVLDNSNGGSQLFYTVQLKKDFVGDWFGAISYTHGNTKDLNSFAASTTRSSFRNLAVAGNSNNPELAFSDYDLKHKVLVYLGKPIKIFGFGSTRISTFIEFAQQGRFSYTYAGNGDINNDGVPSNDLIYIPQDINDIELESYSSMGSMVSIEAQWTALDNFITESPYLNANRGKIAERNGSIFPWYAQANLKLIQSISLTKSKHNLDFIFDIFNVPNLINSSWGVRKFVASPRPIQAMKNGKFRVNPGSLDTEYLDDNGLLSRWQLQIGVRYRFL